MSRQNRAGQGGHGKRLKDREAYLSVKKSMQDQRIFRRETMRHLRRAEICVWLAIHGCHGREGARIGQRKIGDLAGIKGRRHVGDAIKDLCRKGLLEVLEEGRYRSNGDDDGGLASVYRAYPRPEQHLASVSLTKARRRQDKKQSTAAGEGEP